MNYMPFNSVDHDRVYKAEEEYAAAYHAAEENQ